MSASAELPPSERLARLERRAEVIRSRFVRALDALDARRHQVVEVGKQAKAMAKPAVMTILGGAVLLGLGIFAVGAAFRARRRRSLSNRLSDGVAHAMQRVDAAREPSLARKMFDRLALTLVTFIATELGKRATKNAVDGKFLDGHRASGFFTSPAALPRGSVR